MWGIVTKLSVLILAVSVIISLGYRSGEARKNGNYTTCHSFDCSSSHPLSSNQLRRYLLSQNKLATFTSDGANLDYDFYRHSCPQAEQIVRSTVQEIYSSDPKVAPILLRLVFHDCFIHGCDASVLLDSMNGTKSEKDTVPNKSLKGFDFVETIKTKIEQICPETVSCADIVVLAARDALVQAGGPFYPLLTGRQDSEEPFPTIAEQQLPAPPHNLSKIIHLFGQRDFEPKETVALLGAHSIGRVHCQFFEDRLFNFSGTGRADPSIEPDYLRMMQSTCKNSKSSPEEPAMMMDNMKKTGLQFGTHYYKSLLANKSILHSDQQFMVGSDTATWVKEYSNDTTGFYWDFTRVMMKLSNLQYPTGQPAGKIRLKCSTVGGH